MSVSPNENTSQGETTPAGNPAWNDLLNDIPEELHSLITPRLEKWDKSVQDKVQELHSQYDPYKPFAENKIAPEQLEQAMYIFNKLQDNPEAFVEQAINTFGLDYARAAELQQQQQQVQQNPTPQQEIDPDYTNDLGYDITQDPKYQALQSAVQELTGKITSREEQEISTRQEREFETYLDGLKEQHGDYDRLFVTALISNGVDGEAAVKQYHEIANQAAARIAAANAPQQQQAPVVMGGDGVTGSGIPEQPVNMGTMSQNDIDAMVMKVLEASRDD